MPEASHDLLAVYVDGETKTGKGAAGKAIAETLRSQGLSVYYDVAGDFYRRYVAWVRRELGLSESDALPTGEVLLRAAASVYRSGQAYEQDEALLGDLQRPVIGNSVAVLAELPIAQEAGIEWWGKTLELARKAGADVVVLDGRNPRVKVREALKAVDIDVRIALDLFLTCAAEVAGRRLLRARGITEPTAQQLSAATSEVNSRRERDRNRPVHPFVAPEETIAYQLPDMAAEEAVMKSWDKKSGTDLPVAVRLDNSYLPIEDMLSGVSRLAIAAVEYPEARQ